MTYEAINFGKKFGLFHEQWQPKVIAEMNDYQFKLVRLQGDFIWHDHKNTDETFIVLEGVLRIDFRDGAVQLSAGDMFVVPKGVEHKPYAEHEVKLLLIEPRGILNTGHAGGERTAENDVWSADCVAKLFHDHAPLRGGTINVNADRARRAGRRRPS
jgi:mannose-6-phosphate isomerase-like protein (cupin superfamily)